MKIQILDPLVANQIAAGEVIERPASIVKECLENSLDAGATRVEIAVEHGGLQSISITDNGDGIAKEDLPLAVLRHGTSKIFAITDLNSIASLGFRGEALASICAIAKVELTSLEKEADFAWQIKAEGTEAHFTEQPVAHPQGTTITVRDIFFNVPARRRFLRTEKTEFLKIEEVVNRMALSRLNIAFKLSHNQKQIYNLPSAVTKEQQDKRVQQICGKQFIDAALRIDVEVTGLKLWGWIAESSFHRTQADMQFMYVNGRMVRDKLINHAIKQAFSEILSAEYFPAYVLFLECEPNTVDVNVHPTKHEVRFHESRLIHDFIFSAVQKVLRQSTGTTEMSQSSMEYFSSYDKPNKFQIAEAQVAYETLSEDKFFLGNPIGLIENQYLLTLTDTALGLLNIKKTKAILFEKAVKNKLFTSKPLLFPITIQLMENEITNLSQHFSELQKIGFDLEAMGSKQLVLRQVPAFLEPIEFDGLFQDLAKKNSNDFIPLLIKNALNYLRPINNKLEQEKLLKAIQKGFSEIQIKSCFKFLEVGELAKII